MECRGIRGRALVVVDALFGGGAEQHAVDLAQGLRDAGWHVELACSTAGGPPQAVREIGLPCHQLRNSLVKRRFSIGYALGLRRLVADGRFDVVHAHIYASEVAAAVAVIGRRVPLVVTEHTEAPWRGVAARWASRLVYRRASHVIAVSNAIAVTLRGRYGVRSDRLHVLLPVGRQSAAGNPRGRRPVWLPAGLLIGYVGRLQPEKGVGVLLEALRLIRRVLDDAQLVVAGQGPQLPALQRQAELLGIASAVHFLGHRHDAQHILAGLDVLAVPSLSDGSPLVIHEAQQAGTAVVGSRVGGIPDRLAEGKAGVLVPPGSADHLATAIISLLADRTVRTELAEAGRQHASRFTYPAMVDAVAGLYASLLPPADGPATSPPPPQELSERSRSVPRVETDKSRG